MLGSNLTVIINIALGLATVENFSLTHREQLVAKCALVEVISLFLKKKLELFHEKTTHKFILSFFKNI